MRTPLVLLVSLIVVACSGGESPEGAGEASPTAEARQLPSFADADVQRLHNSMMEAMDPTGAYERNRYLAFTWVVQRAEGDPVGRAHRWDRYTGQIRVEAPTDQGTLVATLNANEPDNGEVWLDGVLVTDESKAEWLNRAHGMHINDSYWFVMPYKWADPGVITRYIGAETDEEGRSWEVVELSFENVGRTPQNVYRAYINPASGLMEQWAHYRTSDAEPRYAAWTDWQEFSGARLPLAHPWPDGGGIYIEDVELSAEVAADAFAGPAA